MKTIKKLPGLKGVPLKMPKFSGVGHRNMMPVPALNLHNIATSYNHPDYKM
jgi:hypothetical protein